MERENSLKGAIAMVIGCVSGIGLATVEQLLQEGVKGMVLLDFNIKEGEKVCKDLREKYCKVQHIVFIPCDVTSDTEVAAAFDQAWKRFDAVDLVINCAGILDDRNWKKEIMINVVGTVDTTLTAWNRMRRDRGGRGGTIINTSSIAALEPSYLSPVYTATKAAVKDFGSTLGAPFHYKRTGVRVMTICPGVTDTTLFVDLLEKALDDETGVDLQHFVDISKIQTTESVARGFIEVYTHGTSGSAWLCMNNEPPSLIQTTGSKI